jgi:hypothetical protein
LLAQAKEVLADLELTEWQWTINDVLEQPEPLLWAVFELKKMGEKYKIQALNRKHGSESGETI